MHAATLASPPRYQSSGHQRSAQESGATTIISAINITMLIITIANTLGIINIVHFSIADIVGIIIITR